MENRNIIDTGTNRTGSSGSDWASDESYWRSNHASRPYATTDRGFDYYRPGYQYGYGSANRYRGRSWNDVEPELQRGWNSFEGRGQSTWENVKGAVRDAWDRVTGQDRT